MEIQLYVPGNGNYQRSRRFGGLLRVHGSYRTGQESRMCGDRQEIWLEIWAENLSYLCPLQHGNRGAEDGQRSR